MIDLSGKTFGCLTVLQKVKGPSSQAYWKCRCLCGAILPEVAGQSLRERPHLYCRACQGPATKTNDSALNCLYAQYRCDALRRNKSFELNHDEFLSFVSRPCYYCGSDPIKFGGIDRVENAIGYLPNNCVPCCKICNIAKRDMPRTDFLSWLRRAYQHNFGGSSGIQTNS
jgi:hypothetical protein